MENFTKKELEEIEKILNEKYLFGTDYFVDNLSIKPEHIYFTSNPNDKKPNAYNIDCNLYKANVLNEDFNPNPLGCKVDLEKIAFHIAHDIWVIVDKCKSEKLWDNF